MLISTKSKKLLQFALLSALLVWGVCAYIELGKYMYQGTLFARILNGRPYVSDFANHYNAGVLARRSLYERIAVYDIRVQNESLKSLINPVIPEQPFFLQYPPYFFVLALPLAFLPMQIAWIAWNILAVFLCVLSLLKLASLKDCDSAKGQSPSKGLREAVFIGIVFSSYPAWLSVELGQTSIFLLPALAFMIYFLKANKPLLAGLSSGFLLIKLQYAPLFLLIGLIFGRLRFLAGLSITVLLFFVFSLFVLGVDNLKVYPEALLHGETSDAISGVSSFMMQNLRGELVLLFKEDGGLTKTIVLVFYALSVLFTALLCWKRERFEYCAAITICIALIASPHTHTQDYLILFCLPLLLSSSLSSFKAGSGVLYYSLLFFSPLSWLFFYLQPFFMALSIQAFFIYLLIVLFFIFQESRRERAVVLQEKNPN